MPDDLSPVAQERAAINLERRIQHPSGYAPATVQHIERYKRRFNRPEAKDREIAARCFREHDVLGLPFRVISLREAERGELKFHSSPKIRLMVLAYREWLEENPPNGLLPVEVAKLDEQIQILRERQRDIDKYESPDPDRHKKGSKRSAKWYTKNALSPYAKHQLWIQIQGQINALLGVRMRLLGVLRPQDGLDSARVVLRNISPDMRKDLLRAGLEVTETKTERKLRITPEHGEDAQTIDGTVV